jgi:hypothetical protein
MTGSCNYFVIKGRIKYMAKTKIIKSHIYRSADTGRFVGKKYAKKHPKTTVREVVKKKK